MSPTVFVIISPSHVADCILIILPCHVADVLLESGLNSVGQYWMFYFGFEKYYKSLQRKTNGLGWFAHFRIQFLPDHIMIHSCLVCVSYHIE